MKACKKLYQSYYLPYKMAVMRTGCVRMVHDAGFDLSVKEINYCFFHSIQTKIKTIEDPDVYQKIKFFEFLEFLVRIADRVCQDVEYEKRELKKTPKDAQIKLKEAEEEKRLNENYRERKNIGIGS